MTAEVSNFDAACFLYLDIRRCGMSANETTPSKSQFIKVNHYRSKYGLKLHVSF